MSTRNFYMWLCFTVSGSYLCQLYKNVFIEIISVVLISICVAQVFRERLKGYHANPISHYKFRMVYDFVSIVASSCSLLIIGIFFLDKNDGVHFLLYLLHIVPLLPIIINTMLVNRTNSKQPDVKVKNQIDI